MNDETVEVDNVKTVHINNDEAHRWTPVVATTCLTSRVTHARGDAGEGGAEQR